MSLSNEPSVHGVKHATAQQALTPPAAVTAVVVSTTLAGRLEALATSLEAKAKTEASALWAPHAPWIAGAISMIVGLIAGHKL